MPFFLSMNTTGATSSTMPRPGRRDRRHREDPRLAPSLAVAVRVGDTPAQLFGALWPQDLLELQPNPHAAGGLELPRLKAGATLECLVRGAAGPLASVWRRIRATAVPHGAHEVSQFVRLVDPDVLDDPLCPELAALRRDLDALLRAPFLAILDAEELPTVLAMLRQRHFAIGARLMTQAEAGNSLFIIQHGVCKVLVEKDGRQYEEARLGPGEVVGEMAALTGDRRSATVVAEDEVLAWELQARDFEAMAAATPELRQFLTELLTHRLESALHPADRVVGRYRIQSKLGQGGYALVYAGVHDILGLPVAIKMLKHTLAMEPEFAATFRREAQVIARLNHPNVVRIFDIEEHCRTIFIIMERLEGRSLKEELRRQGRLRPAQAADIARQICQGLEYAHGHGIIHRDIKPANIFLPLCGPLKVLDFGLACVSGLDDRCFEGTAAYMAPEQILGNVLDARTDLYALGCTVHELVTGRLPFEAEDVLQLEEMHLTAPFPDPAASVPDLPPVLAAFIRTCTQKDPAARYASAAQACEALRPLLDPAAAVRPPSRRLLTLHCVHTESQRQALEALVQEFTQRAQSLGVTLRASEFGEL
ncbi:protein kinase domain-containing protein [Megalodesulfovibrio gigas]|nr:protein kinase [Megalodesulfovibrio gigas]